MRPQFLDGIRFVDFTWAGAGPFGTKVFSDFGAEVLKIESAARPDPVRCGGPYKDRKPGINRSGYFASRNSGKKSVSLNLKEPEAAANPIMEGAVRLTAETARGHQARREARQAAGR